MPLLQDYNFPSPSSPERFEELCADLFLEVWQLSGVVMHGRSGQSQKGVDGYGYTVDRSIVGYQSKSVRSANPSKIKFDLIKREVLLAREFKPALSQFYFLSASESDSALQERVRLLSEQNIADGYFLVHVLGWSELKRRLGDSPRLIRKYYPELNTYPTPPDALAITSFLPPEYIEKTGEELLQQVDILRKSRFFLGFDAIATARNLASMVQSGNFRHAPASSRSLALSLCVRLLYRDDLAYAKSLLLEALTLHADNARIVAELVNAWEEEPAVSITKLLQMHDADALTAAFIVKSKQSDNAVEWLAEAGYKLSDLSSDGKVLYIQALAANGRWADVRSATAKLLDEDYDNTPALLLLTALGHLSAAMNDELMELVVVVLPLNLESFPLLSNAFGLSSRDQAIAFFKRTEAVAKSLGLTQTEHMAADHHLWLRLRSLELCEDARRELCDSLQDEEQSLARINFAIHFNVPFDRDAIKTRITNYQARFGNDAPIAAFAIFCLVLDERDPEIVLAQIGKHAPALNKLVGELEVARIQCIMLVQAHRYDEADQLHMKLKEMGLYDEGLLRLRAIIDEGRGGDPVMTRLNVFSSTGSVTDLQKLVAALYDCKDWVRLVDYARRLYQSIGSVESLELYCAGLSGLEDDEALLAELECRPEFIPQSKKLQLHWCWLLYRFGRFTECSAALEVYRTRFGEQEERHLEISLLVASGQWPSLMGILDREFGNEALTDPKELLYLVQIAQAVNWGIDRVKEFVQRAVDHAADDAHVYLVAHSIAIKADWETDQAASWLAKAIELSGDTGPVRSVSLREIIDWQTAWSEVRAMIHREVTRGNMPMYVVSHLLHQSLVASLLLPIVANPDQDDMRRRTPLFTSSSVARNPISFASAAFDISTIFLLAKLDVLETSFEMFDTAVLPHETMTWLFDQKAKYHQPSRVRIARVVMNLLGEGKITVQDDLVVLDPLLVREVGTDLASLITTAASTTGRQALVVRSFPVHRAGSILDEVANIDAYSGILCSLTSLIEKLWSRGHLTSDEYSRALRFLHSEDKRWPQEPEIQDEAVFFLDNVSISYLGHLGLLEKIIRAGYSVTISRSAHAETNGLVKYADYASTSDGLIERIQNTVSRLFKKGRVCFARKQNTQRFERVEQKLGQYPTNRILDLVGTVGTIIVDDRSINRHAFVEDEQGHRAEIVSTWELLTAIYESEKIKLEELYAMRTELRGMGLVHLPVDVKELNTYLQVARVEDEQVVETNELKSWRRSIILSRISELALFPAELPWLHSMTQSLVSLIGELWTMNEDVSTKRARSAWLFALFDTHESFHIQVTKEESRPVQSLKANLIVSLIFVNDNFDPTVHQAYKEWIDDVMQHIQEDDPNTYRQVIEIIQAQFVNIGDPDSVGEKEEV